MKLSVDEIAKRLLSKVDAAAGAWLEWRTWKFIEESIDEPELTSINFRKGQLDVVLSHPGVATLASECVSFLQAHNAPNFVEMELMPRIDKGSRGVIVTIAYKDGETPAWQIKRLKQEIAALHTNPVCPACKSALVFDAGVWRCEHEPERNPHDDPA